MDDTTISSLMRSTESGSTSGTVNISLGLVLPCAPIYLFTVEGLWPGWQPILAAFLAVAVIFGANWVVEPATYFPMLGVSGTYQAWLVGNISNKLLPASVTAQAATDTKPGGKRAELIAVAAISGAVIVHVFSMIVVVALLGNWIISILPDEFVTPLITFFLRLSVQYSFSSHSWSRMQFQLSFHWFLGSSAYSFSSRRYQEWQLSYSQLS